MDADEKVSIIKGVVTFVLLINILSKLILGFDPDVYMLDLFYLAAYSVIACIGSYEALVKIGTAIIRGFTEIGATMTGWTVSLYKFLLSPLTRDYRAREENYKMIIRGLQRELAKEGKLDDLEDRVQEVAKVMSRAGMTAEEWANNVQENTRTNGL